MCGPLNWILSLSQPTITPGNLCHPSSVILPSPMNRTQFPRRPITRPCRPPLRTRGKRKARKHTRPFPGQPHMHPPQPLPPIFLLFLQALYLPRPSQLRRRPPLPFNDQLHKGHIGSTTVSHPPTFALQTTSPSSRKPFPSHPPHHCSHLHQHHHSPS